MSSLTHLEELTRPAYELLPNNQRSRGLTNQIVIAGAHELYGFTIASTNGVAQFFLIFDLAALPSDGAVPDVVFTVPAASSQGVQYLPPRKMYQGVVICNSTTAGTKTLGALDSFFDVQYL